MNRRTALLSALGAVLLLVAFYFVAWAPKSEEIALIEEEIEATLAEQQRVRGQVAALEAVRATAPEIEAAIVAAEAIVPREPALPSALRQLQQAADDSGVALIAVNPGRPVQVEEAQPGLAAITLTLVMEGSYFQVVDFLRRLEDPDLTARGVLVESVALNLADAYPTLSVSVTGRMFALLPVPPAPAAPETEPAAGTEDGETAEEEQS